MPAVDSESIKNELFDYDLPMSFQLKVLDLIDAYKEEIQKTDSQRMEDIIERIHRKGFCDPKECEWCRKRQLCQLAKETRDLLFRYESRQKA